MLFTLSTARFAQRVSLIRNETYVNEEVDPRILVGKLKSQLRETREQLLALQGKAPPPGPLTPDERERCLRALREFLAESAAASAAAAAAAAGGNAAITTAPGNEHLVWGGSLRPLFVNSTKVGFFLEQLKAMYNRSPGGASGAGAAGAVGATGAGAGDGDAAAGLGELASARGPGGAGASAAAAAEAAAYQEEVRRLRLQLHARDNEIAILAGMLQQRDGAAPGRAAALADDAKLRAVLEGRPLPSAAVLQRVEAGAAQLQARVGGGAAPDTASGLSRGEQQELVDRASAFEAYKATYPDRDAIESNKSALRASIEEGKAVGESVNAARTAVGSAKEQLARVRQERLTNDVRAAADGAEDPSAGAPTEEEVRCLHLKRVHFHDPHYSFGLYPHFWSTFAVNILFNIVSIDCVAGPYGAREALVPRRLPAPQRPAHTDRVAAAYDGEAAPQDAERLRQLVCDRAGEGQVRARPRLRSAHAHARCASARARACADPGSRRARLRQRRVRLRPEHGALARAGVSAGVQAAHADGLGGRVWRSAQPCACGGAGPGGGCRSVCLHGE